MQQDDTQVRRLTRAELYERVWTTPMTRLAAEFGVSDVVLSKFCRKHYIPTPPQGYWMMSAERKAALRPELGDSPGTEENLTIHASQATRAKTASNIPIEVIVPAELVNPRPVIAATARALRSGKRGEDGLVTPRTQGALPIRVGPESVDRSARILNALISCLEQRGHSFACKTTERGSVMKATVAGEEVAILFGEETDRKERELTAHEKQMQERNPWLYQQPLYTYSPSGRLFLKLDHYCTGLRKNWADGKRQRLEQCLGDFVAQLETVAAQYKADREEREAADKRRHTWELERAEKLAAIKREEEKLARLHANADAWHRSQRLRRFADAVRVAATEGRVRSDEELERWLAWVSDQADRLDPLAKSPSSILDEKQKYESYYY